MGDAIDLMLYEKKFPPLSSFDRFSGMDRNEEKSTGQSRATGTALRFLIRIVSCELAVQRTNIPTHLFCYAKPIHPAASDSSKLGL